MTLRPISALTLLLCVLVLPPSAQAQADTDQAALVAEADALMASIQKNRDEVLELKDQLPGKQGEGLTLLERRIKDRQLQAISDVDEFCKNVLEQETAGLDATRFRQQAQVWLAEFSPLIRAYIDSSLAAVEKEDAGREGLSGEELIRFEEQLNEERSRIDLGYEVLAEHVEQRSALGMDASSERSYLTDGLTDRAEVLATRIRLSREQIDSVEGRLKDAPDDAALQAELRAVQTKLDGSIQSLELVVKMMNGQELETANYQRLLIEASGDITTDILDHKVALSLLQQWLGRMRDWVVTNGPGLLFKLILFVVILAIFRFLARVVRRVVQRALAASKLKLSNLAAEMLVSTVSNAIMVVGLLVALSQLGISLGPLLAGLGIVGFIIGFALQDALANFASGVMILIYRPFDVDDMVEAAAVFGKVKHMSLVSTTILTVDNQTLIVPNAKIWGDVIKNVTAQKVRRVDLVFGISYTDDIPKTEQVLEAILKEHPKVLDDPEPVVKLHTLNDSSVDFVVRPWVKTEDYWDVHWDVTREVKMRFDREGISIPFPQRDVHYYEEKLLAGGGRASG